MRSFRFEFQWRRLKDVRGNDFIYGTELGKLRSLAAHPAIYRWIVECDGRQVKAYIGETEELGRRLYHYLKPGPTQHSNLRLREEFLSAKAQGLDVFLDIFEFEPFELNGVQISAETLHKKHVRRAIEALICLQCDEGVESLNR